MEKAFFDQLVKNDLITYENIQKTAATGCLLDYNYFKDYNDKITIYLSKEQALDADPKAIHQINFTANLDRGIQAAIYFIIEETKEAILYFSQGTVRVL